MGADGYVPEATTKSSVILTSVSKELVEGVSRLSDAFGIYTSIKRSKQTPCKYTLVDGEERTSKCKEYRYDVSFGNYESKLRLLHRVGIFHVEKTRKLRDYLTKGLTKCPTNLSVNVLCVEPTGHFVDMYCAVVPEVHGLVIEGVMSSNCSEKSLPAYGVCNLLSPNHEMFSVDPVEYTQELAFLAPYIVRMSDNVTEYESRHKLSPLPEQAWILQESREIGIGLTNIHGWFLKGDMAYDSDEAIEAISNFFKTYSCEVFKASIALGVEKGNAPAFDRIKNKEALMGSTYFKNIVNELFDGDYTKVISMRNMAHMSIAPTGSLSSTFPKPCFSYGVEPFTGPYYWRRTRAIDKGTYTHYFMIPKKVQDYVLAKLNTDSYDYQELSAFSGSALDEDGSIGIKLSGIIDRNLPKGFFKPAHYIDPIQKVKLMSGIYKWVDAAISCTYNLPDTATRDDVENIYMSAYDHGVRAVSVYVDGSREGILIFEDPKTNESKHRKTSACGSDERPLGIIPNCAPKRPTELPCDIVFTSIKGETWTVLIGLLDGKIFEIFCGSSEDLYLPKTCKEGIIRKQGKGKYELEVMIRKSPVIYKDLASILMTDSQKAITRLLSLNLRHGVLPKFIVEQLKKTNGSISDFSTAISRVLSRYVDTYELKEGENTCPNCGENSLAFVEGCVKCMAGCHYSRCG
jgi:ribonucleoside-diphosphate reductase alpha chain